MFILSYANFSTAYRRYAQLDQKSLFDLLGWADPAGLPGHAANGAVLTSLALLAAGIPVNGSVKIEAGPLAGSKAINGANRLAEWLAQRHTAPEILSLDAGMPGIVDSLLGRRGIVAFIQGTGPAGGMIGLLDGRNAGALCRAAEHKHPLAVHFWALN